MERQKVSAKKMTLRSAPRSPRTGKVYFVGAGPGDPALITCKGALLLKKADCVVYDRLVEPSLLKLTGLRCRKIYVGKEADEGGHSQPSINRILRREAKRLGTVVRLKGGDPTVFGRISEELEDLARAGIPFEIVPGVSSVWAAAAAAGIPLTDRRFSSSVAIVAGHQAAGKERKVRWETLAKGMDTLVILMGRAALPAIAKALLKAGRPGSTPVALIRWATTPDQEVLFTSLSRLEADLAWRPDFGPPVVAIVGEVVQLAYKFSKNRLKVVGESLKGRKILVTRPSSDSKELTSRLQKLGASCTHLPTIEIRQVSLSGGQRKELLRKLPRFHWILFTSHHGVEVLERLLRRAGKDFSVLKAKICAIGPRTEQAVKEAGGRAELVPADFSKKGIVAELGRLPVSGKRLLIPRSNLGIGDDFAEDLRRRGALVEEVTLYETVMPAIGPSRIKKAISHVDAMTFTSASTVTGFFRALRKAKMPAKKALNGAKAVAIGPSTAEALRENGIKRYWMPRKSWTLDGLVEAVERALAN